MSISAEKRRLQTVDRSNNLYQRAGKRTSSSRFNSPDSKSTSSQISHTNIFELSIQNLLPIINKLKQENQHMTNQKNIIQQEMNKLNSLSNNLVKQNQALRQHYQQRTIDIQQLIQTITINTKQDLSDINHLIFSFRESNGIFIKNINLKQSQNKQIGDRIKLLQKELQLMTTQNINKETTIRNNQVKNQQLNKKVKKLKSNTKTLLNLDGLQKQVCDLLVDVNIMKKSNLKSLRFLKQKRYQLDYEKPTMKYQTIQAIKGVKQLKSQIDRIKTDCNRMENKNSQLQRQNNNILFKVNQMQASNQRKRRNLNNIIQKIKNAQKNTYKSQQQIKNKIPQLRQKQAMKQKLDKQLQLYQKQQQKIQNNHNIIKSDKQIQSSRQIQRIKQQISMTNKDIMIQLQTDFLPIKHQQNQKISNLKYQLQVLNSRVNQLQNVLNNMRNPQKDIIRMEFQLNKMENRQRV